MTWTEAGVHRFDEANAWYALHTRHQHEKAVAEMLTNHGYETFLPLYPMVRQWKDRIKHLAMPMFPCYLFLHGGLDRKQQIVMTPGVHAIVGTAGRPAIIPQLEIDAIRRIVESPLQIEPHPFLNCGDRVKIKSGSLIGIEGILVRKHDALRLVLSVEMLGRSVAVEVDASIVEPVGEGGNFGAPRDMAKVSAASFHRILGYTGQS
jgi:transcription antitermination factor NusG